MNDGYTFFSFHKNTRIRKSSNGIDWLEEKEQGSTVLKS